MSEQLPPSKCGPVSGLLDSHVEAFVARLRAEGYADRTLQKKRSPARSFVRWICLTELEPGELNDSHVGAYVADCPPTSRAQTALNAAAARQFVGHLRLEGVAPWHTVEVDESPIEAVLNSYVCYLRGEKGLAENSIKVYVPYVKAFLCRHYDRGCCFGLELDAPTVHAFVIERVQGRSSEYARLLGAALRSFLRFLYVHEHAAIDLSFAVPSVRSWRQATVPAFLAPEQVEQVLSATDRAAASGMQSCFCWHALAYEQAK